MIDLLILENFENITFNSPEESQLERQWASMLPLKIISVLQVCTNVEFSKLRTFQKSMNVRILVMSLHNRATSLVTKFQMKTYKACKGIIAWTSNPTYINFSRQTIHQILVLDHVIDFTMLVLNLHQKRLAKTSLDVLIELINKKMLLITAYS